MSYSQNGNNSRGNNSGNNFDFTAPAGPIIKDVNKPFYLGKPVTFHNFSILHLHMKKKIWISGITFDLVVSTWQYILGISKKYKKAELAADITYQHLLMS